MNDFLRRPLAEAQALMGLWWPRIVDTLVRAFAFDDNAEPEEVLLSINRSVDFHGSTTASLICAIVVASVGLNVNSTAVVIGAMIISPLMGPLLGIGAATALADAGLLSKSLRNLATMVLIAIASSTLYFFFSPLTEAQTELQGRTHPTIWDVIIAFGGGMAGIFAITRRDKNITMAGVAIATALMPPLCTVGYGLANWRWDFVLGAFYLFFINSVFIGLSAFVGLKMLGYRAPSNALRAQGRRAAIIFGLVGAFTLIPSVIMGYRIVQKSIFERNANRFISHALDSLDHVAIARTQFSYEPGQATIEAFTIGRRLEPEELDALRSTMPAYQLSNTRLIVRQSIDGVEIPQAQDLRMTLMRDLVAYQDSLREAERRRQRSLGFTVPDSVLVDVERELVAINPSVERLYLVQARSANRKQFIVELTEPGTRASTQVISTYLKVRMRRFATHPDSLDVRVLGRTTEAVRAGSRS